MIIDNDLLDQVSAQAKASPRLRMNYNFHQSLEDKCHRMLNAVEPGTVVPIHRHPTKDESFVVLRGKVKVTTYNDDGSIIEDVVLSQESGNYGVDIPKNVFLVTGVGKNKDVCVGERYSGEGIVIGLKILDGLSVKAKGSLGW